jgi:hypothetical protein
MKRDYLLFAILFSCTAIWSNHSIAAGALAVGVPANVAKQGFAYGFVNNKASANDASATALSTCRKPSPVKSDPARALCAVINTYHDQCVAVAEDPQAGTPGIGWAIAGDLHTAEAQALSNCEATAGPGRRAACIVDHSQCDGTAK